MIQIVTIRTIHADGRLETVPVGAEMLTDHLAITPAIEEARLEGGWTITHIPTGQALAPISGCMDCVRKAVPVLLAHEVDWSGSDADVLHANDAAKAAATAAYRAMAGCDKAVGWKQVTP